MGKLNIAHHKSYHPYRRDNIEKVRRDEEEARLKEEVEEGRMMLADAEARIDLLRQRAGLGSAKKRQEGSVDQATEWTRGGGEGEEEEERDDGSGDARPSLSSSLTTPQGHINLFEDLERKSMPITIRTTAATQKGKETEEAEKGVRFAPSEKDRNPWYNSNPNREPNQKPDEDRTLRDLARKSAHDPLTSINTRLAIRAANNGNHERKTTFSSFGNQRWNKRGPIPPVLPPPSSTSTSTSTSTASSTAGGGGGITTVVGGSSSSEKKDPATRPIEERQKRETSERQRALELIARKKKEADMKLRGSETPSTVFGGGGGDGGGGYGDVYNRKEVEEAHRYRDRKWDRHDRGFRSKR